MRYTWDTMLPERAFRRFGGKLLTLEGGGGSGGGTSTSVTQNYSPEEAARRAKVMDEAGTIYDSTKDTLANSPYPGSAPTPFSTASTQAQQMMMQNAVAAQPAIDSLGRSVQFGLTDAMDVNSNPHLQGAIAAAIDPITKQYMNPTGVMSTIRTGANEAGQFGGSRQGIAEGLAAQGYMGAVGATAQKMASDQYQRGMDTFEKTMLFAPQAMDAMTLPATWLSGVGTQQESLAQAQADYNAQAQMWDLNSPWMGLQNYANIVFGAGSGGGTTTSTNNGGGYSRSPLMGALSGAAIGSTFGPWGAVAGGILGLMG